MNDLISFFLSIVALILAYIAGAESDFTFMVPAAIAAFAAWVFVSPGARI